MTTRHPHPRRRPGGPSTQAGVMLLEALVAILIFSLGVLSVIQLQAVSIKQASGAEHRSLAALLANDLISRMWASDKTAATLQANFASATGGAGYNQWLNTVRNSGLPNVSSAMSTLPTVTFTTIPGAGALGGTPSSQVTVTVFWRAPGDNTTHNYQVVAQLK